MQKSATTNDSSGAFSLKGKAAAFGSSFKKSGKGITHDKDPANTEHEVSPKFYGYARTWATQGNLPWLAR